MRTSSTSSPTPRASQTPNGQTTPEASLSSTPTSEPTTPPQSFGPNFEWVTGRLQYSDLEGGTWTLEFTDNPGEADPYGGKFVLAEGVPEGFQAGDQVTVTGSVAEQQMGINMAGTYYEVKSMVHAGVER
jgi:hypothetical protein